MIRYAENNCGVKIRTSLFFEMCEKSSARWGVTVKNDNAVAKNHLRVSELGLIAFVNKQGIKSIKYICIPLIVVVVVVVVTILQPSGDRASPPSRFDSEWRIYIV